MKLKYFIGCFVFTLFFTQVILCIVLINFSHRFRNYINGGINNNLHKTGVLKFNRINVIEFNLFDHRLGHCFSLFQF